MAQEYRVRASEIRALPEAARRRSLAWDKRWRESSVDTSGKPQRPQQSVQVVTDTTPFRERRPLPIILDIPAHILKRLDDDHHAVRSRALDDVSDRWEREGWEKQRDPMTVIRYRTCEHVSCECPFAGEMIVRPDAAADIIRALTKGPRTSSLPAKRTPAPAPVAPAPAPAPVPTPAPAPAPAAPYVFRLPWQPIAYPPNLTDRQRAVWERRQKQLQILWELAHFGEPWPDNA